MPLPGRIDHERTNGTAHLHYFDHHQHERCGDAGDPETCCDERERALIAAMRAYLRPKHAPQSLIDRLEATLDHCCDE